MRRRALAGAIAALLTASAASAAEPKPKAVFEPVSYAEDLDLRSVFFVDEDTGWAAGEAGTILHTVDGGESWTAQLGGDPHGAESPIDDLRFLDRNTGWAVGAAEVTVQRKLLGTTDGRTWRQVGVVGTPLGSYTDYAFTSSRTGFFLEGGTGSVSAIHRTRDGGRTWDPVLPRCTAKVRLAGLNKEIGCRLTDLFFLTPEVGWAVGGGPAGTVVLLRTQDGGESWQHLFVEANLGHPDEQHADQHVFFVDESRGFLSLPRSDKLLSTQDGGKTWQAVPVAIDDGGVRFADPEVGWILGGEKLLYTADGGATWGSRAIRFPAAIADFAVPSRRRAYVVGPSGMVFRYRLVEAQYSNPDAIAAPLLPGVDDPLNPALADVRRSAESLGAKLDGAAASEPAGTVVDCCGTELASLESEVATFVADVAPATARYRNLNLVVAGIRLVARLKGEADGMRDALRALKAAPNVEAASAALDELLSRVDAAKALIAEGFDAPPPLDAAPGSGDSPPAMAVEEPAPAPAASSPPPERSDRKKLLDKLKGKLKIR